MVNKNAPEYRFGQSIDDATPAQWDSLRSSSCNVAKPRHYTTQGVECIDYIRQQVEDPCSYLEGNVIKYLHRYRLKGRPIEDLKKAKVYLTWLIEELDNDA